MYQSISQKESEQVRRTRRRIYVAIPIAFFLSAAYMAVYQYYQIAFNFTDSLEAKIFFINTSRLPERGDYVVFNPPKNVVYPEGNIRFVKIVLGVVDDRVDVQGQDVRLNSKYVGTAQPVSSKGLPLTVTKAGVVPKDHYFVWTPHKNSFDSRYAEIGWIHKDRVIGTAYRIY